MAKKEEAFALFSQGKRMPQDEVQALGIKPETLNKYWTEWVLSGMPWLPKENTPVIPEKE